MAFQVNDAIVWAGDLSGKEPLREGVVTKVRKDLVWVNGQHKEEDCIYAAYCWPARVGEELTKILAERRRLQAAVDDSMKLIYELRNAVVRGEI